MSTYEVMMTFRVDDPDVRIDDVEAAANELRVEAERRPGWFVDLELVDLVVED